MNIQAIIVTNCIGCAVLILLLISNGVVHRRRHLSDRLFFSMIVITMLTCITEMCTFMLDGIRFPYSRIFSMLGNSWLYLSLLIMPFIWCMYADLRLFHSRKRLQRYYPWIGIPVAAGVLCVAVNPFLHFLFSIDEENFYHRETGSYICYTVTCLYLVYSIYLRFAHRRRSGNARFFPIWMFLTPVMIGATAQLLVYGISVAWCCVGLGLAGIHMTLQNEISYLDTLTKLFNRTYLDNNLNYLSKKNRRFAGIMIDMDDFKSINDNYGHAVGDNALVDTAWILRSAAVEKADVYRFAGDEFILLYRTQEEQDVLLLMAKIRKELENFNSVSKRQYHLSFSMGYTMFEPGISDADTFLRSMDAAMYEEKKYKHTRRTLGEPPLAL